MSRPASRQGPGAALGVTRAGGGGQECVPFGCDGCGAVVGASGVSVTLHCGQLCNTFCPPSRYATAPASQLGQTICFFEMKRWTFVPCPVTSRTQTVSHVGQLIAAVAAVAVAELC